MKTKHLHDMVIEAILKRGAIEVPSKTRKYRTFTRPAADGFYFVGKAGALRAGKSASNSVSLERGAFYMAIQEAYRDQFAKPEMTDEDIEAATEAAYDAACPCMGDIHANLRRLS